jgi:DnaK suppressor protein
MTDADRAAFAALIRARLTEAADDARRAARAEADIDLSAACVGGKLDRTEALYRLAAARTAAARREAAVARLNAALARTARRDYGRCAGCGGTIPPARLRADPAATHCTGCAG